MLDHSCRVLLISGLFLTTFFPSVTRADQIVLLVDEHGHKIYVNANDTPMSVNWMTRGLGTNLGASTSPLPEEIDRLLEQTATRHQVDPNLVRAIVKVESDYDPKAISRKGAMGLMQLVPDTARRLGVVNPFDPQQNLEGGVSHLRYLLDLFRGDLGLSLAAYNAGEHAVQRSGGIPAFTETRQYVRKIRSLYGTGDTAAKTLWKTPPEPSITRYVDQYGVMHYTNLE